MRQLMLRKLIVIGVLLASGCSLVPEFAHRPTYHNPFPQLSKVAIAPFFNLSNEPTVDGRKVAIAYFNALQTVPGFEVVPVGVVESAIRDNRIALRGPADARLLAQILDVDAVIVGAVTDYSPYYPPRCGLQVEWYSANPAFHAIPPGYGLPWGKPEEEQIPAPLVFEAEMALAKAQMATQTPPYDKPLERPITQDANDPGNEGGPLGQDGQHSGDPAGGSKGSPRSGGSDSIRSLQYTTTAGSTLAGGPHGASQPGFPANWPDPRGFIPPPPHTQPPTCWPSDTPVIRHTKTYNGNDPDVTEALSTFYFFRNDARSGGWQSYLQRSDDFVRFCCHMHVSETLTARGGAGETRVVWRWPANR
jgi:hypothetical protein